MATSTQAPITELIAYRAAQIQAAEAPVLAAGVPLMAVAADGLAQVIARVSTQAGGPILVLVGGGNNGGDGLFAAVRLAEMGHHVTVITATGSPHADGLAAVRAAGIKVLASGDPELEVHARTARVWVDALTGIGAQGPLRGELLHLVGQLADFRDDAVVVAADLPSGVLADSGVVAGPVLAADYTVTFGGYKPAHFLPPAAYLCGQVELVELPIDFPGVDEARQLRRILPAGARASLKLPTFADHKYTRGVVEVFAGSAQFPGAGVLACGGALRCGAGMVRYLGPAANLVLASWPEVVTVPGGSDAVVVGPGSDTAQAEAGIEAGLAANLPIIADAAAIGLIPPAPGQSRPILLTPHAGELAQLLGITSAAVLDDVEAAAVRAAQQIGAAVLVKGAITVIATPDAGVRYSQADGTPWLATAGSGDVLAGIAGALAAANKPSDAAAMARVGAMAALIHGRAGRHAAGQSLDWENPLVVQPGSHPIIASDIIVALPQVFGELS